MRLLFTCIALTLFTTAAPLAAQETTEGEPVLAWYTVETEGGSIVAQGHRIEITTVVGERYSELDVDGETSKIGLFQGLFYSGMGEGPDPESVEAEVIYQSGSSGKRTNPDGSTVETESTKHKHKNDDGTVVTASREKIETTDANGNTTTITIIISSTKPPTIR